MPVGTMTVYCSTCERNVYVAEDDTPVCPVCSGPLIATVELRDQNEEESEASS
jgi:hypothetical protein